MQVLQAALNIIAPTLFELCDNKNATVAKVKSREVILQFRRWLNDDLARCWVKIWEDVENYCLVSEPDRIFWKLEKMKKNSVK